MCWMCWSKGSTHSGFPPRMEKVLLAHLDAEQKWKSLDEETKATKPHIKCLRRFVCTSQSGPGSPPVPAPSSNTHTGLFLRRGWTRGPLLGSGRSLSCRSGSCPESNSHLTEVRRVRERNKEQLWSFAASMKPKDTAGELFCYYWREKQCSSFILFCILRYKTCWLYYYLWSICFCIEM